MAPTSPSKETLESRNWDMLWHRLDRQDETLQMLHHAVYGNEGEGLKDRVQGLETGQKIAAWLGGVIFVALLGAILAT